MKRLFQAKKFPTIRERFNNRMVTEELARQVLGVTDVRCHCKHAERMDENYGDGKFLMDRETTLYLKFFRCDDANYQIGVWPA